MSQKKPGVVVLNWEPRPPDHIPDPILEDDSAHFSEEIVKDVRHWLASTIDEYQSKPPTPVTICKKGVVVGGKDNPVLQLMSKTFDHYSIEILLRARDNAIAMRYRYLGARDRESGRVIIGPKLRELQSERI